MPSRFDELSLEAVKTLSIQDRKCKVHVSEFGASPHGGMSSSQFLATIPEILGGKDLRRLTTTMVQSLRNRREWIVLMGGHVVKTGMAPIFRPFLERGLVTAVGMNGSAAIHDVEIALFGKTSEIVEENLANGTFGMVRETSDFLNGAADRAAERGEGFGERLGAELIEVRAPHLDQSFLALCSRRGIPATVHVALGTDIVHQHPTARGASIGEVTLRDFKILAARVAALDHGTVWNVGSAVVMPEVFLKALTCARNLGAQVGDFSAVNFDMIRQYRPGVNVVDRPTRGSGWGAHFSGQHELLLPLVAAFLLDSLEVTAGPISTR